MCLIRRKLIAFLFICQPGSFLTKSIRVDPSEQPEPRMIDMVEGNGLEIICNVGNGKPVFHSDEIHFPPSQRNLSSEFELFSRDETKVVYKKSNMSFEDSGWYRCEESGYFIYVSVKSNTGFFIDDIIHPTPKLVLNKNWEKLEIENDVWISCKPTSSSYAVHVYKNGELFKPLPRRADPKKDYIYVSYPGIYKCELRNDDRVVAMKEYNVTDEYSVPHALIDRNKCSHFNNQTKFRANCTIAHPYLSSTAHAFHHLKLMSPEWKILKNYGVNYTIKDYPSTQHPIFGNYLISTKELTIHAISDYRTREFECNIENDIGIEKQKMHVIVNRLNFQGINLSTNFSKLSKIIRAVGDEVQFVVAIEAYPDQPDIIWRDPKGRKIFTNKNKFLVKNTCEETKLDISNLNLEDGGYYRVEARTPDSKSEKSINFNLEIWERRFIKTLNNLAKYYMHNESARINCIVDESRRLNITWSFRKRSDFQSSSSNNILEDIIIGSDKTTIVLKVQSSGYITCIACEISEDIPGKCDNLTRPIFMTDVPGGFGIISPTRKIMTNENVELICAASVYHFTEKVEWLEGNGKPVIISDRVNINVTRSELSYRTTLTFNSIRGTDNGKYICRSTSIKGQKEKTNYTLRAYDPVKPYFMKTNMNGSIDKNLDSKTNSEHIVLECYPGGIPQSVVSWWKDGEQINTANQTDTPVCKNSFRNDSQQLYIDNLDEDCSGLYQCWATNKIGAIEAHQNIIIKKTESLEPTGTEPPASEKIISQDAIIIGIVILILAIFCLGLIIFLWKERRRATRKLKQMGQEDFREGTLDFLKHGLTSADQTQFLPYKELEFPKKNLELKEELGSGSFGVVEIARAKDLFGKGTNWLVAVKKPNKKQDKYVSIKTLARELKIMIHLGKHLNVVNLLGACTKDIKNFELLVIIEYCAFGNLRNYLKNNDLEFISQIDAVTGKIDLSIVSVTPNESTERRSIESSYKIPNTVDSLDKFPSSDVVDGGKEHFSNAVTDTAKAKCDCELGTDDTPSYYSGPPNQRKFADEEFLPLRTSTLLSWAFQVSNGMEYLRRRKVIHGDLAARNILLAKRNIVKISDFGLSKELHERENYKKTSDGPLPFKWMAIESLKDGIISSQSDVWSFGIALWEFFELGNQPYMNILKSELLEKLENGYRMEKPKYATQKLYDLMMQCWNTEPNSRPSFVNLIDKIGSIMDQDEKIRLEKSNLPYQNEHKKVSKGGKNDELLDSSELP